MKLPEAILWNDRVRLVFSDVDETVADLYRPAELGMLDAITRLLDRGIRLVLITGQSVDSVEQRIVMRLPTSVRKQIAVGACSGAELWGYSTAGDRNAIPSDSAIGLLNEEQMSAWREVVQKLVAEFELATYPVMPIPEFRLQYGNDPQNVLLDDRGPQITLEFPNAYRLSAAEREKISRRLGINIEDTDLRIAFSRRAEQALRARSLPVTPRMAGIFAVDLVIEGVSKTRAVQAALRSDVLGLGPSVPSASEIEIWGDRFSQQAGTDWLMCTALHPSVRAISFRDEDPAEFPLGYNIQKWSGEHRLHAGLLEFLELQRRSTN